MKTSREKQQITYKGIPIMITDNLSTETLQTRREEQDICKVIKGKYLQPRLLSQLGYNSYSMAKSQDLQVSHITNAKGIL